MQTFPAEIIEEINIESMGYKEDLQRVHDKIDRLGEQFGNSAQRTLPVSKWTKAAPIIAACALLLAVFVAYTNHSAGDLKNQIKIGVGAQLKDHLRQFSETESDVRAIKEYLALGGVHSFLSTPKSKSEEGLPQLRKSLELVSHTKVDVPPATIEQVRLRLADMKPTSPDYWSTVVRFLQFATTGFSPKVPPPGLPSNHRTINDERNCL